MSLQRRLTLVLLISLLALLVPLGAFMLYEVRRVALVALETAASARLGLYRAVSPGAIEPLAALAQEFGGYGFVDFDGRRYYTDTGDHHLPPAVERALAMGARYHGLHGQELFVTLPLEGGGVGLAIRMQELAALGTRLLIACLLAAGVLFALVGLMGRWALAGVIRPLRALSSAIEGRSPHNLSPLADPGIPELQPTIRGLNRLMSDLSYALERLQRQEQAARRFAAQASHELRTPLTALRGYVELLERAPEDRRVRAGVRHELDRLQALLDAFLTLARLEARSQAVLQPIDLAPFFAHHFPTLPLQGGGCVLAEPELLLLAVRNLLDNAHKYGRPPYRLYVEKHDGLMWLWLEDNGPGFPADIASRAFAPFVHGDNHGTGLGLAIVQAIAEVHGGAVRLVNAVSGGARVGLALRLSPHYVSPEGASLSPSALERMAMEVSG